MNFKSAKFELNGETFQDPEAAAHVEMFASGRVAGALRYKGASVEFSNATLDELDHLATMIVFVVERLHEEKVKFL